MDILLNNFILNKTHFLKNVQKTNKSWEIDKFNNWPPTFLFQFADCEWPDHKGCISLLYKLYDDDVVEIPKNHPFVEVIGAVKYPGLYEYGSNQSMNYYINQAGGITGSESRDIFIIKAHTNQRIKYKGHTIESGDIIYIAEKINWDRRTKILDTVSVTQAIASTLSMILTILIATGSVNGV